MITARLNKSVRGFSFSRRPPRSQGKGQWRGRGAFVAPITAQDTWIETGCLLPSDTLQSSVQVGSQILWRPINCRKNPNWSQSRSIPPDPSRPIHPTRSIPFTASRSPLKMEWRMTRHFKGWRYWNRPSNSLTFDWIYIQNIWPMNEWNETRSPT